MSDTSAIEWTDATWNIVTGCHKLKQGCKNCFAEREWARLSAPREKPNVYTGRAFTDVACHPERLVLPVLWRKPRRVFVTSMGDPFHKDVPTEFIDKTFAVMRRARDHTFQLLTKRTERMAEYFQDPDLPYRVAKAGLEVELCGMESIPRFPLPNVWLGFSAEDQETFNERWEPLCGEAFAGWPLWLSAEPLLGHVNASAAMPNELFSNLASWQGGELKWVVAGGESGPKARPSHPDWFRSLRDQCQAAGVPFFFKQWGEWREDWGAIQDLGLRDETQIPGNGYAKIEGYTAEFYRPGKRKAGRLLDGRTWDEFPQ